MAALAIGEPSLCGEINKAGVDRDDVGAGLQQPEIEAVDRAFVTAGDERHPGFQQTGRRQKPGFRLGDRFVETVRFRLFRERWRSGPTYRSPSVWQPVSVITDDFVGRARIAVWQLSDATADRAHFGKAPLRIPTALIEALQCVFERLVDDAGHGLSGLLFQGAREANGVLSLDGNGHAHPPIWVMDTRLGAGS